MPKFLFFPYFAPNRRSDRRLVELRVDFDLEKVKEGSPRRLEDIRPLLIEAGVLKEGDTFPRKPVLDEGMESYASLLAQTAILFQHLCGHKVSFFSVLSEPDNNRCTALVEYEHCDVGMTAVKMAVGLFNGQLQSLLMPFQQFSLFAQERLLPAETRAIIKAASSRSIPCFQLEQEPFTNQIKLAHRVRRNGLLVLGHGATSRIVDGTFCVDQSSEYQAALLRNPDLRLSLLKELGIPVIDATGHANKEASLLHMLVIDKRITALAQSGSDKNQIVEDIHPSIIEMAMAISAQTGVGPLAIKFIAPDATRPLSETDGRVLNFDLAPDLGRFFDQCDDAHSLLSSAAADMVDCLFPATHDPRMPIIAVTGTNGKTTSCRMITHIMKESGRKPGLVCTDGIFLNGKQISDADAGSLIGHFRVLTSKSVDVAVLESHHRGIAVRGFAYDKCDVAVCLNVTEEHLKEGEIESVEEMTRIKRALLERASNAAVLNADDSNCISMLDRVTAKRICLVSLHSDVGQLQKLIGTGNACFCVLEYIENRQWLVIYDRDERTVLMCVDQIPATFNGTAAFNTSNAMHAVAASYLLGTPLKAISAALKTFSAGLDMTPGRMNVFDELPFRVIIDFAHTPDGMLKVREFVDMQKVDGRKLIAIPGTDSRTERANRLCAQAVAGHFDFYFCRDYDPEEYEWTNAMAPIIQRSLVEAGVPENQTSVVGYGREVIFGILDNCKPGDLLVLFGGHFGIKAFPEYLKEYAQYHLQAPTVD